MEDSVALIAAILFVVIAYFFITGLMSGSSRQGSAGGDIEEYGEGHRLLRFDEDPPADKPVSLGENIPIAGISFAEHKRSAARFVAGTAQRLTLIREPTNSHDSRAIAVIGEWLDSAGRFHSAPIGYVPQEWSHQIAILAPDRPLAASLRLLFLPERGRSPGARFDIWTTEKISRRK